MAVRFLCTESLSILNVLLGDDPLTVRAGSRPDIPIQTVPPPQIVDRVSLHAVFLGDPGGQPPGKGQVPLGTPVCLQVRDDAESRFYRQWFSGLEHTPRVFTHPLSHVPRHSRHWKLQTGALPPYQVPTGNNCLKFARIILNHTQMRTQCFVSTQS